MTLYRSTSFVKSVSKTLCGSEPMLLKFDRFCSKKSPKFTDGPIDPEINFHSNLADQWWDMKTVKPLHYLNEVRVPFIRDGIIQSKPQMMGSSSTRFTLDGIEILDVGCGGGILSEALARLKANVIGLDPSTDLINIARKHAERDPQLQCCLRYESESVHNFCNKNSNKFDAVVVSEVIEHISNKQKFIQDCVTCLKPGGLLFFTTPNKTFWGRALIIIFAESVGIIPPGTHEYDKFITPEDLSKLLVACDSVVISNLEKRRFSNAIVIIRRGWNSKIKSAIYGTIPNYKMENFNHQ